MNQPLDLSIMLLQPPSDSPTDVIAGITLRCDALGLSHFGDLLRDPLTPQKRDDLRWYLEEYWKWPYEGFALRGKQVEDLLVEVGKRLYEAAFGNDSAKGIVQAWQRQPDGQRQISITSDIPGVLSLPWELLHDADGFLALRKPVPVAIVRCLPQSGPPAEVAAFELPLRILLVTARPEDAGFVDPRSIAHGLLDALEEHIAAGMIELEFLRPATMSALRERLKNTARPIHVLHFDGHGQFDEREKQGMLAFEDEDGLLDRVKAQDLAQVLQESGVRVVILNACQSAQVAADDAFSSVAAQLLRRDVDAVVAMSASILVTSAARYVEAFYQALVATFSVPMAQERARQALYNDPHRDLRRRYRDEEGISVKLYDWWLPHFYQRRPLVLQSLKPGGESVESQQKLLAPRFSEYMPPKPRYGFSGRARELHRIERSLLRGNLVLISGFGGVGKTALAREAADWLTRTKMYEGACFISLSQGGDVAMLLSTLGTYVGVYDSHYHPNDTKAALKRLDPALKERRVLIIVDNLEGILAGGEAPLGEAERAVLWDILLELAQRGAGMLLTSRDSAFGDGRLAPGRQTMHLLLKGLYPEDAYALASCLLTDLGIDRARVPYRELRDLLAKLDHHPLAIQLVLPVLREQPLALIQAEFEKLLHTFVDHAETGRNRSLLASLEYSLQRLSKEQQAVLHRLALFDGGAMEGLMLEITEIPNSVWVKLCPTLERAALITVEKVHHEGNPVRFLRFHPVLIPYLRSQPGAEDELLRIRYIQQYHQLSSYLEHIDSRYPQQTRAIVRRELPNLRRALELLLQEGKLDAASAMVHSIGMFLTLFGLTRERDALRQRVIEVATSKAKHDVLTHPEWRREMDLSEDELSRGNLQAAFGRLESLLSRIEMQTEGEALGRGSREHCLTLYILARCLEADGRPEAAETKLREALSIINAFIKQHPENQSANDIRGGVLGDLADVLVAQGQYVLAQQKYEQALAAYNQIGDLRSQGVVLERLGNLALEQHVYTEAKLRYVESLDRWKRLGEPPGVATVLYQLGMLALKQAKWAEAEEYSRESLAISERFGHTAEAARTCSQLADIARHANRPYEAVSWSQAALERIERVEAGGSTHALYLDKLAVLIVDEVRAVRMNKQSLAEARRYTEQALAIKEKLDPSMGVWNSLNILASIADLEGMSEAARVYRRRERETYAAFDGNRYETDHQYGSVISAIVKAAKGDAQQRVAVEGALPLIEKQGWHIAEAVHRIWAGERDWHLLVEDLDRYDALFLLRVLETLAEPTEAQQKYIIQEGSSLADGLLKAEENPGVYIVHFPSSSTDQEEEKGKDRDEWLGIIDFMVNQALPQTEEDLATTPEGLDSMAYRHYSQGRYEQAAGLLERALAIREQELGADHLDTARCLNNLAEVYREQKKYEQAQPFYERALAIYEQKQGLNHPDTARCFNYLGLLYGDQKKYEQALGFLERALAIRQQVLGPNHPETAQSLNNLALFYHEQSKYEQAEPLYERALMIYEQELGLQHAETAQCLYNLAWVYENQSKYEQAEPLLKRALVFMEQSLGSQHPNTERALNHYTELLRKINAARMEQADS